MLCHFRMLLVTNFAALLLLLMLSTNLPAQRLTMPMMTMSNQTPSCPACEGGTCLSSRSQQAFCPSTGQALLQEQQEQRFGQQLPAPFRRVLVVTRPWGCSFRMEVIRERRFGRCLGGWLEQRQSPATNIRGFSQPSDSLMPEGVRVDRWNPEFSSEFPGDRSEF